MRDPLLAPAAALMGGVLLSRAVSLTVWEALGAAVGFGLLSWVALRFASRRAALGCGLLGILAVGALAEAGHRRGPAPELEEEGRLLVEGCVVSPPSLDETRERALIEIAEGARIQATFLSKPALRYGQRVEFEARVRKPRNFGNPGSFDYAGYLARQGVYWIATARAGDGVKVLPGECGSRVAGWVAELRAAGLERIARLYPGQRYETAMMQAVLLGETFALERVWTEDFRRTGTFHALVISGSHVAVIASVLLFLMRLLPPALALSITAAMGWLYAMVAGWQAPVTRAAAGLTLYLIARLVFRRARPLNLLAAIAMGFLLLDPEQLFEASFQLSFLAVAFLGAFAGPLVERTSGARRRGLADLWNADRDPKLEPVAAAFRTEMRLLAETLWFLPRAAAGIVVTGAARAAFFVWDLFALSAVVQAGLALPMVVYFHRVGVSGLTANIAVVPLLGVSVPAGMLAMFTGWGLPAEVARLCLVGARAVAGWHAAREPQWRIPDPPDWLGAAIAALLVAFALSWRARPAWRWASGGALAAALSALLLHPFPPAVARGRLELTAIDVGQGDAFLLVSPEGRTLLMDAGGLVQFGAAATAPRLEIGEDVVSPYLWSRGLRRLDAVAVSHAQQDHAGGVAAVLDNFEVGEVWAGVGVSGRLWDAMRKKAEARDVRVRLRARGEAFDFGGARVEIVSPDAATPSANANDESLAMRVSYGRRAFLLMGDLEAAGETELVASGAPVRADVLKVAHHGSRTSSTGLLLDAVRPAVALIPAGYANAYGHPHPLVMGRLRERGVAVYRTDEWGSITVRTDGWRVEVEP